MRMVHPNPRLGSAMALLLPALLVGQQGSTVTGVVRNSVTRAGIADVEVRFYSPESLLRVAMTDAVGGFRFTGVERGSFQFHIEKEGFADPSIQAGSPQQVRVNGTTDLAFDFELVPLTTVIGSVVDSDGAPVPGASVRLFTTEFPLYEVKTQENGNYRIEQVRPGRYRIRVQPGPEAAPSNPGPLEAEANDDGPHRDLVTTFYPSTVDPDLAQIVEVTGIGDPAPFQVALQRAPSYRIQGRVLDSAGDPAPGIRVNRATIADSGQFRTRFADTELHVALGSLASEGSYAVTDEDGRFELRGAMPGEWILDALSESQWDEEQGTDRQSRGRTIVHVSRADLRDIEIRLADKFALAAAVDYNFDPKPEGRLYGALILIPVDGGQAVEGTTQAPARVQRSAIPLPAGQEGDATLYFERAYPDRYRVLAGISPLPGVYVAQVLSGGQDVRGVEIDLSPASPPLRVIYRRGAATVEASLRDPGARGAEGTVVVIPADTQRLDYTRSRLCTSGAACRVENLRPGSYWVGAFDRIDVRWLSDPSRLPDLARFLTRVSVREGQSERVELDLRPWPN